jgi:predicted nucleic acid-binding protein
MSNKNWAFDTNIFIYLLDKNSPFHRQAKAAFTLAEKKDMTIVVCQQTILELIQVLTDYYHLSLKTAAIKAKEILAGPVRLVAPLPQTIKPYLELCQKADGKAKRHFDLYLAATLIDNKIETLITNDKSGFKGIKKLKVRLLN